jgi:serine/threonine protein phosphatase 1
LGDYIDRGPASEGVVELLAGHRVSRPRRVFLKGNHEDRMLAFLDDPAVQGPGWMKFGGREALLSYGVSDADLETEDWPHIRDRLVNGLPQRHLAFLTGLEMALRWRNYLFVHAGLNPARGLQTQDLHDLMWIREPFLSSEQDWGLCVVHGHAIEPEPVFRPNRMGLDTGAYRSGILTCAAIDADQVRIIQTP